jgi:four helix bundle protein
MNEAELKARTKRFAVDIIEFARTLPKEFVVLEITRQMIRSAMSVGANYRSSCRGRSDEEFIARLGVVEDEADETMFWLELLVDSNLVKRPVVARLINEADEIVAIMVSSIRTARHRLAARKSARR